MTKFKEYSDYDATGLAKLISKGDVSSSEVLEAALDAADRINPSLNAIVHRFDDKARKANSHLPDGPFKGVPFLLKDLIDVYAGEPFSQGSRFFRDYIPDYDSELVKRFKAAGLNIFGKTNTPEFGITPMTDPELFGSTCNPWNTDKTAGGSSGGTGAAVAAGIVPAASGGDGGGSIRMPASANGIVGLKTTRGRTPTGPFLGDIWFGMAVQFALTRTVRDTAALLDAVAGPQLSSDPGPANIAPKPDRPYLDEVQAKDRKLRIAFSTDPMLGESLHPECKAGVENTAKLLTDLGHEVTNATPKIDREEFIYHFGVLVAADIAAVIEDGRQLVGRTPRKNDFEAKTWAVAKLGKSYTSQAVTEAIWYVHKLGRQMGQFMEKHDVFLTSTVGMPPTNTGHLNPKGMDAIALNLMNSLPLGKLAARKEIVLQVAAPSFEWMSQTPIANATGQPSISLPLHWSSDGLPVGMLFTGRFGDEATLIRLAAQLERALPWKDKKPPIYA